VSIGGFSLLFANMRHSVAPWLAGGAMLLLSLAWAVDFAALERQLLARFGLSRIAVLRDWQVQLSEAGRAAELDKLRIVNDFINRAIEFDEDLSIFNYSDYWATPLETIGHGRGDCEDFAIIKYFSLKNAGIAPAKLRLVYVKAQLGGPAGARTQAHMVLAYYATPAAEPLVLDNLVPEIVPASRRRDLQPVFSFNSEAIWNGAAGNAARGRNLGQLSRWQDLLLRAEKEGFQ